jgi:D-alanyl-D-alanine carboxypeptidase (penicillin-binding protein 5/6)
MIRTPESETKYIGKIFETDINTYLVADYDSGEILAGKNIDNKRPMASFAKVMTAYRLMKEGLNISRSTTYDPDDHRSIYPRFRVAKGEKILNRNLMYAGLVSSLNTPIKMMVDTVEEDELKFVTRMNEQIKEWGLNNTKFVDVTGEDLKNETTARDYLQIYTKAINNVDVGKILGVKSYEYNELLDLDGKPYHFDDNSNLLTKYTDLGFKIVNSKTGYLDEAGSGLVMLVQRKTDNKNFIIISMGNPDYANRFEEPRLLTEWAISQF